MKLINLLLLLFIFGCATKYIIPGNRFITPETQGEGLKGSIEFQQTEASQLTIDTTNGSVKDGVKYSNIKRSGFQFSQAFIESFDFIWAHTGSANSMFGGKFQVLGASRGSNGSGHKLSIAALIGNNEHETDDGSIKFELGGKEFLIIYGYRVNESFLPYLAFSQATYNFTGKVSSSDPVLNGLEPNLATRSYGLNLGTEFSMNPFFAKLEGTYQKLKTSDTKDKDCLVFGYSLGLSW
jgi:hypothetical protein